MKAKPDSNGNGKAIHEEGQAQLEGYGEAVNVGNNSFGNVGNGVSLKLKNTTQQGNIGPEMEEACDIDLDALW